MNTYLRAPSVGASLSPLGHLRAADPCAAQVINHTPGAGINTSHEKSAAPGTPKPVLVSTFFAQP